MHFQYHRDNTDYFHIGRCNCQEHFHRSIELIYTISNAKPVTVDGQSFFLEEGELLIVPPFYTHYFPIENNHRSVCVVLPVAFSDTYNQYTADKHPESLVLKNKALTMDLYTHLLQLQNCDMPLLKNGIYSYVLAKILQNVVFSELDKRENTLFAAEVLKYIEQHYAETLTQESLSKAFGYNRHYFSSLFNKTLHISFSSYLNIVRINKAIPMLSSHPIAEISESVGFGNVQSFYQNFKKVTGTSPAEYLRTIKKT